ncbi:MAG: hypothetical protein HQ495_02725 [Alphaproteobacteria bacterium]|nr:hypothetical protein [Alphaproteobacteria bacterium]
MFHGLLSRLNVAAIAALVGTAFLIGVSGNAMAQSQTVNYTASVVVQNTFTVGMSTPISFGTVAAVSDTTAGTSQAQIVLQANSGTTAVTQGVGNTARLLSIVAPTPGVINISNAPPSTAITITNGAQISLTNPADTNAPGFFFTVSAIGAGFNNTTDVAGALVVNVGGTLTTKQQTVSAYSDGTYTGSFAVTFAF